jgi:hypothetical protein
MKWFFLVLECVASLSCARGEANAFPGSGRNVGGASGAGSSKGASDEGGPNAEEGGSPGTGAASPGADGGPIAEAGCALGHPALTGVASCDQCQQVNCCDDIAACLASPECSSLFGCTMACSSGASPEGGAIDSDSSTAVDDCWTQCEGAASADALALFSSQDDCVAMACTAPCQIH